MELTTSDDDLQARFRAGQARFKAARDREAAPQASTPQRAHVPPASKPNRSKVDNLSTSVSRDCPEPSTMELASRVEGIITDAEERGVRFLSFKAIADRLLGSDRSPKLSQRIGRVLTCMARAGRLERFGTVTWILVRNKDASSRSPPWKASGAPNNSQQPNHETLSELAQAADPPAPEGNPRCPACGRAMASQSYAGEDGSPGRVVFHCSRCNTFHW